MQMVHLRRKAKIVPYKIMVSVLECAHFLFNNELKESVKNVNMCSKRFIHSTFISTHWSSANSASFCLCTLFYSLCL